jgi:membrane-associated protein
LCGGCYFALFIYKITIFKKEDSIFFNKKYVTRAQGFYEEHGKKTIILARFLPIVRTFAPIVAGIGKMSYRSFILFNVTGGFIWTWTMLWLGYGLGSLITEPDKYVLPIIVIIIALSAISPVREVLKGYRKSRIGQNGDQRGF